MGQVSHGRDKGDVANLFILLDAFCHLKHYFLPLVLNLSNAKSESDEVVYPGVLMHPRGFLVPVCKRICAHAALAKALFVVVLDALSRVPASIKVGIDEAVANVSPLVAPKDDARDLRHIQEAWRISFVPVEKGDILSYSQRDGIRISAVIVGWHWRAPPDEVLKVERQLEHGQAVGLEVPVLSRDLAARFGLSINEP